MIKHKKIAKQQGAVLITVLILTLGLTVLVLSQMDIIILDEKVIANQKDRSLAFQAAESAIREAENWLVDQATEPEPMTNGASNVWVTDAPSANNEWWMYNDNTWWKSSASQAMAAQSDLPGIEASNKPRYIIEHYAYVQDTLVSGQQRDELGRDFYRITARGYGGTETARVTLQSTYTRRY
ncbi:MAG TPA: pilus assembly protein PilZ [Thiothrix sp.]|nr:pilus assembly protein PilZ [Thiothrix sp.]